MLDSYVNIDRLQTAFRQPLPGAKAQLRLAADYRIKELLAPRPPITRAAAVLLVLFSSGGRWHFPLIQRTSNPRDRHSGQVSLPGGSQESHESIQDTAFREAEEEIGVARDKLMFIGELSTIYIPPSNFTVTPCVAVIDERPEFCCDANEVADLFEVPLSLLMDPGSFRLEEVEVHGMKVQAPLYRMGSLKIFGATAMILSEFLALLEYCKPAAEPVRLSGLSALSQCH